MQPFETYAGCRYQGFTRSLLRDTIGRVVKQAIHDMMANSTDCVTGGGVVLRDQVTGCRNLPMSVSNVGISRHVAMISDNPLLTSRRMHTTISQVLVAQEYAGLR